METTPGSRYISAAVKPLESEYSAVISATTRTPVAYRGSLCVNSLSLGRLTPKQYLPVARRSQQILRLVLFGISEACRLIAKLDGNATDIEWVSVSAPAKFILSLDSAKAVTRFLEKYGIKEKSRLCLEISSEILFEDREKANSALEALKKTGITIAVSGYGDEYCPTMRLSKLPIDYIILDEYVTKALDEATLSPIPSSLTAYIKALGYKVILENAENEGQFEESYRLGCFGATRRDEEKITAEKLTELAREVSDQ